MTSKAFDNATDANRQQGGRRNLIINGAMQVAQRGTSVSVNSTSSFSSPDRFLFQQNANGNSTIEQSTDVPSGEGFNYSTKITNGTGETRNGSDFGRLYYRAEGYDSNHLNLGTSSAKAFTLSFWVKSSLTGTFGVGFALDTTGLLSSSYTINTANTWEHKTITVSAETFTGGSRSSTNGIGLQVHWDMGEGPDRSQSTGFYSVGSPSHMGLTGGVKFVETTGATFYLTGVQLEVGTVATPFEHRSYGEELALCQRYFERIENNDTNGFVRFGMGYARVNNNAHITLFPTTTMRSIPTLSTSSVGTFKVDRQGGNLLEVSSIALDRASIKAVQLSITITTTGLTTGEGIAFLCDGTDTAFLDLDSEL